MRNTYTDRFGKEHSTLHMIMYYKGWYSGHFADWASRPREEANAQTMLGLKTIIADWSGMTPEDVSDRDVLFHATSLWQELAMQTTEHAHRDVVNLFQNIFYSGNYYHEPVTPFLAIDRMLVDLSQMFVKDLPPLPKPDNDILPITVHPYDVMDFAYNDASSKVWEKNEAKQIIENSTYIGKSELVEKCIWYGYELDGNFYIGRDGTMDLWNASEKHIEKYITVKEMCHEN